MAKLVIFDLDGTLVNSVNSIAYCGNHALKKLGFKEIDPQQYRFFAGDGVDSLLEKILRFSGEKTLDKFDDLKKFYAEIFETGCLHEVKPYDKINETLKELKNKNVKIAVFSNKIHYNACKVVETIFKKDTFDYVLGHKLPNPKKPDPTGALFIAKELGIDSKDCIYVGDTDTDMKTGTSASMFTVGVSWGFRPVEELKKYGAMKIISSPLELLELI